MPTRTQIMYVCTECGEEHAKWQGKCDNCGVWNTLKEITISKTKNRTNVKTVDTTVVTLNDIKLGDINRMSTKIGEFDRVLGGGIVPGSIILLGGDPGIGKSTLLLQTSVNIENALYISGEESVEQIKMRFDRLGLKSDNLKVLAETDLQSIVSAIEQLKPQIVIIDSIQTIYSNDFPSTPGSIVQVRECALRLQQLAKTSKTAIILVGHVTKEGSVAGPRILEHLVDAVIYLEGERSYQNRILRAVKNRFGTTDEIGIFEMDEKGLAEVENPSKLYLDQRSAAPGSVVTALIEGSRALLIEVQALTTTTVFGYPQRRAVGFDLNRLQLLIAVLQKRANLQLANQDIFINVVGGMKANEPAIDAAIALAIISAYKNKSIKSTVCAYGEVGLSGEIRAVPFDKKRQAEAKRLGLKDIISSKNVEQLVKENKIYE